jgi:hypothetical protein
MIGGKGCFQTSPDNPSFLDMTADGGASLPPISRECLNVGRVGGHCIGQTAVTQPCPKYDSSGCVLISDGGCGFHIQVEVCLATPATGVVHLPDKNATVILNTWYGPNRTIDSERDAISGTLDITRWQKSADNSSTTGDVTLTDVTFPDGGHISTGRITDID